MRWRYYEALRFDDVTLRFVGDDVETNFLDSLTQTAVTVYPETRPMSKGKARS